VAFPVQCFSRSGRSTYHAVSLRDALTGVLHRAADLDMGIAPSAHAPSPAIGSMATAVAERQ
jgi:hypothetical protein